MPKFSYPKRPKAPKASASTAVHERYAQKMKDWNSKCSQVDKDKKSHENAVKRTQTLKNSAGRRSARA